MFQGLHIVHVYTCVAIGVKFAQEQITVSQLLKFGPGGLIRFLFLALLVYGR